MTRCGYGRRDGVSGAAGACAAEGAADAGRAFKAPGTRDGCRGGGKGRGGPGGGPDRGVVADGGKREGRARCGRRAAAGPPAPARRRPQAAGGDRSRPGRGAGEADQGRDARGPGIAAGMDDPQRGAPGGRADRRRAPVQRLHGLADAEADGLHPAVELPGPGRTAAPGAGRAVPAYRRAVAGVPGVRGPGDQRGFQEKGEGRELRARRPRAGARGRSRHRPVPRLPGQEAGARHPVRHLRREGQRRVRERRHRREHRRPRGGISPPLVAGRGPGRLPRCPAAAGHLRLRRLQRLHEQGMEGRPGRARPGNRPGHRGLPLPARHAMPLLVSCELPRD